MFRLIFTVLNRDSSLLRTVSIRGNIPSAGFWVQSSGFRVMTVGAQPEPRFKEYLLICKSLVLNMILENLVLCFSRKMYDSLRFYKCL